MAAYVEFYITCNPPLLPKGVDNIIDQVLKKFEPENQVFEILYEPDIPWFKVISSSKGQAEITAHFESCLEQLCELEIGLVDDGHLDDDDDVKLSPDDFHSRPDVEIFTEDPQVIPWSSYRYDEATVSAQYGHRYPESINFLRHKEVWRGLESVEGLTLSRLLGQFSFLWSTSDFGEGPEVDSSKGLLKLEAASNCTISYNMGGNMVYIGSDISMQVVEDALRKLWNLYGLWGVRSSGTTQLVFTEGEGPFQFFFRYLSHLELFRSTYIDTQVPDQEKEYSHLLHAAALRVQTQGPRGLWISDKKVYNRVTDSNVTSWTRFSAFAQYEFTCKKPYTAVSTAHKKLLRRASDELQARRSTPSIKVDEFVSNSSEIPVRMEDPVDIQVVGAHLSSTPRTLAVAHNPFKGIVANENFATAHPQVKDERVSLHRHQQSPSTPIAPSSRAFEEAQSRAVAAVNSWMAKLEKPDGSQAADSSFSLGADLILDPSSEVRRPASSNACSKDLIGLEFESEFSSCQPLESQVEDTSRNAEDILLAGIQPMPRTPRMKHPSLREQNLLDHNSPEKQFHGMFAAMKPSKPGNTSAPCPLPAAENTPARPEDLMDFSGPRISILSLFEADERQESPITTIAKDYTTCRKGATSDQEVERKDKIRQKLDALKAKQTGAYSQGGLQDISDNDPEVAIAETVENASKHSQQEELQQVEDQIATFTLKDDLEKEVIKTMKQQAPKRGTWAQIASTSKGKDEILRDDESRGGKSRGTSQGNGPRASIARSATSTPPSSGMTQIVPGLDVQDIMSKSTQRTKPIGHSATLAKASEEVKELMKILQVTPGEVKVEARFGRAGIKGLPPSIVDSNSGSSAEQVLEALNQKSAVDNGVGFYPILTTKDEEMELLPRINGLKDGRWKHSETKVLYDIFCTSDEGPRIVIEVDAESFEYRCRNLRQDLSGLVIHCVQRAWDIKVCVTCEDFSHIPRDFEVFAKSIVDSLGISISAEGGILVEAKQDSRQGYSIAGVKVRSVAKYQSETGRSCLTITMTQPVKRLGAYFHNTSIYRGSTRPAGVPGKTALTQWFEASITSTPIEEVLVENVGLELGEITCWDPEHLLTRDSIQAMVDPALRMVTQMDSVGCTNDHGQKHSLGQQFYDPMAEQQEDRGDWCYCIVYAYKLNYVMRNTPLEAQKYLADPPFTSDDIRKTYDRVKQHGINWDVNLPPRKDRRYIIVGGSGLVGSQIILFLIAKGTPPEAIRIVDNRPPTRAELLVSPAGDVHFVLADVTSAAAVLAAFTAPWSAATAHLPLTVFHTAALIRPAERYPLVYHRLSKVNVVGTAHVLAASKAAGAGILILTSSSLAALKPVGWFYPPWRSQPRNFVQVLTEKDFDQPLRAPGDWPTCYSRSKAEAERLVCEADAADGMRTGAIRPGNAVYGSKGDLVFGRLVSLGRIPTWTAPWAQNWANAGNVALAHLQYEDALLGPHGAGVAGRPFMVTDDGAPVRFKDMYRIIVATSVKDFIVDYPPPLLLLLLAYSIEAYDLLLVRFPWLQRWIPELKDPINLVQPATFDSAVSCIVDDSRARKQPIEGGFGYRSSCTTLEGMCAQMAAWNEEVLASERGKGAATSGGTKK